LFLVNLAKYLFRKLDIRKVSLVNQISVTGEHNVDQELAFTHEKVSIIIPTRDNLSLLKSCINSIIEITEYKDFEILVVNNDSTKTETLEYLLALQNQGIKVIDYPHKFNFSAICNFAASQATGEYLCFLNNDTKILLPNWLSSMVEHASVRDVGIVGAVLTFPDSTFQHVGISLQHGGIAGHPYRGMGKDSLLAKDCFQVSGVTFACAVISKRKFETLGGLDTRFPVGYNDVDFSIRCLRQGFRNIVCVRAHLEHAESQSRPRSKSLKGFRQAFVDVVRIIRKHPKFPHELFFSR
jgi:GT2 family glycosyltransferase